MTMLNPMGYAPKIPHTSPVPRLTAMNNKTVYLMDCRFDDSEVLLKPLEAWCAEHLPSVTTVGTATTCPGTGDDMRVGNTESTTQAWRNPIATNSAEPISPC